MYSSSYQRGGDDTHVHVHAAPPTKDQQIGMSGLIIALIAILAIIVVSIMVYKNQNAVTTTANTTAATTSNVAVPMSSTTSTGFVDTVICGSTTVPGYYVTAPTAPPAPVMGSSVATGTYGYVKYVTELDFTSGYWMITINAMISADSTSAYYANALNSNLSNYQIYVALDPAMTTIPGTSTPYSFATDGIYAINNQEQGNGCFFGAMNSSANANPVGSGAPYYFNNEVNLMSMPTFTTYVNVPSDITYYIFNVCLFNNTITTGITSYDQCPFINSISWNVTRLSNPIPEATMPYSSYFAPVTATPTGSGGAAAGASSYKKAGFYGGGNVYDQYY